MPLLTATATRCRSGERPSSWCRRTVAAVAALAAVPAAVGDATSCPPARRSRSDAAQRFPVATAVGGLAQQRPTAAGQRELRSRPAFTPVSRCVSHAVAPGRGRGGIAPLWHAGLEPSGKAGEFLAVPPGRRPPQEGAMRRRLAQDVAPHPSSARSDGRGSGRNAPARAGPGRPRDRRVGAGRGQSGPERDALGGDMAGAATRYAGPAQGRTACRDRAALRGRGSGQVHPRATR